MRCDDLVFVAPGLSLGSDPDRLRERADIGAQTRIPSEGTRGRVVVRRW